MKSSSSYSRVGNVRMRYRGAVLRGSASAGRRASGLSAAVIVGVTVAFLPALASAVSTANAEYAATLRLEPRLDHGAQLFEQCAACHGRDGDGSTDGFVPAIAGQFVPVLVKQIIDFRYDARDGIRVQGFLAHHHLTSQDLADVVAYVSNLPPRQPPLSRETGQTAHGAALFENLCAGCHGSRGEGDPGTGAPRLAGQHSEYLAEQLRDAAQGTRPGMERDHARLLAQLSVDDMNALAEYLAGVAPVAH